jgi:hypothetical protein
MWAYHAIEPTDAAVAPAMAVREAKNGAAAWVDADRAYASVPQFLTVSLLCMLAFHRAPSAHILGGQVRCGTRDEASPIQSDFFPLNGFHTILSADNPTSGPLEGVGARHTCWLRKPARATSRGNWEDNIAAVAFRLKDE